MFQRRAGTTVAFLVGACSVAALQFVAPRAPLYAGQNSKIHERKVPVNGQKLFVRCIGEAAPTVVLEAGLGDSIEVWDAVQPSLARVTRVCAYDRAGNGKSDKSGEGNRSPIVAVSELHELLQHANVRGPYVLVGHSYGGLLVRLFAQTYPGAVAGMVLIDSSHEGLRSPDPAAGSPMFMTRESLDIGVGFSAARAKPWHSDIPLLVLARHKSRDEFPPSLAKDQLDALRAQHETEQLELSKRSPQGRIIWVDDASHYIQRDRPQLVVEAVRAVVEEVRQGRSR